jgi:hypothetical protein
MIKRRRILLILTLSLLGAYFVYNYMYKEHRNIKTETSKIEIAAPYLLERFKTNDAESLLNTTITVIGVITNIEEGTITIDSSVHCAFNDKIIGLNINDSVKVKGRCIGYDDLFEVVKLDQCSIIK